MEHFSPPTICSNVFRVGFCSGRAVIIGPIRRGCLDQVIVLERVHLHRVRESYFAYYHRCGTHLSLAKDAPQARRVQLPEEGKIIAFPEAGGF